MNNEDNIAAEARIPRVLALVGLAVVGKKHPCLLQYPSLSEQDKEKDRNMVRHYPDIVDLAGYKIVAAEGR